MPRLNAQKSEIERQIAEVEATLESAQQQYDAATDPLYARLRQVQEARNQAEVAKARLQETCPYIELVGELQHVRQAASGQLLLYHELVSQFADKPVRLQFAVLTKTKQPQLDVHTVAVDPQRTARIRQLIERVWRAIQDGHFYPAASVMNCAGCPFQRACQCWPGS